MGTARIESVGRYELLVELAKGGMAELFFARLHGVGGFTRIVAVKRILPHLADDKQFVDLFLNEGRIAAQLQHPNVCQVFELGEADGNLFLSMEYLKGVTWDVMVREQQRTPAANETVLRLTAGVIAQACEGLHYAHAVRDHDGTPTPVIHRDVSPQNLFVTTEGTCKVLDFGVSKMLKDGPRTRSGVLKGKLPYMSPEQIQGDPIDPRSDVFALGIIVWEALAGEPLFHRDTDYQIWKAITEEPIPPLAPRGYPPEVDAVLGAALARDRAQRFSSARALGEALRRAAANVGGAYTLAEIGAVLHATCGDQIAEREREIAKVLAERRARPPLELSARSHGDGPTEPDAADADAGATISLRSKPVRVARRASRKRWSVVLGGLALVAATTAILVLLVTPGSDNAAKPETVPAVQEVEPMAEVVRASTSQELQVTPEAIDGGIDGRTGAAKPATTATRKGRTTMVPKVKAARPTGRRGSAAVAPPSTKPTARLGSAAVAPPSAPGMFSVGSDKFATIYIDGVRVGDTPLFKHPVSAGPHTVRAVRGIDGREKTFVIEIEPGKLVNIGRLSW